MLSASHRLERRRIRWALALYRTQPMWIALGVAIMDALTAFVWGTDPQLGVDVASHSFLIGGLALNIWMLQHALGEGQTIDRTHIRPPDNADIGIWRSYWIRCNCTLLEKNVVLFFIVAYFILCLASLVLVSHESNSECFHYGILVLAMALGFFSPMSLMTGKWAFQTTEEVD